MIRTADVSRLVVVFCVMLLIVACASVNANPPTLPPVSTQPTRANVEPTRLSDLTSPTVVEPTRAPDQPTPIVSHGGPVKDHVSFVDALRAQGYQVEITGEVEQPFLRARGTSLRVTGGNLNGVAELQSFNYDDTDLQTDGLKAAAEDASQIESNGQPKTMRIEWITPPHFFRKERVIVIYVGNDPSVISILTELLGPQFAGK